uniref:Uncharacterized protein n=1 Tax=Chromera velia CCMP2878 TaxID=1169474 RepID=A0A0G4IEJ7_9ALVE|eukprot:Cvel_13648.t1-p1 / transcript=Cvel_13648.t1 / gene=Cvel_13648 / organism=Chromera_velia_CCMP2878 / gene_product=hypothetical protein / transcript_product=hypothetical protein / location=Cvel_scaffold941:18201-22800(+) / protein_length=299 / sequence_SO=supercontig / SO=protein_coding / is_pseudo=false
MTRHLRREGGDSVVREGGGGVETDGSLEEVTAAVAKELVGVVEEMQEGMVGESPLVELARGLTLRRSTDLYLPEVTSLCFPLLIRMGKFRSVVLNLLRGFAPILSTQDIDRIVAQFGSTTDGVFNVSVNQLNTTYEEVEPVLPPPESATAWQGIMAKAITHQRVNTQSFANALAASEADSKLNFAWIPTELHQEDLGSDAFGMIEVLDHLIDPPERHRKAAKATAVSSIPSRGEGKMKEQNFTFPVHVLMLPSARLELSRMGMAEQLEVQRALLFRRLRDLNTLAMFGIPASVNKVSGR